MLEQIRVTGSSTEILEASCPVDNHQFEPGDAVVQCPGICKRWYHVECWRFNQNRCATLGCTGSGSVSDRPPPELPPAPLDLSEITVVPALGSSVLNDGANDELLAEIEIVSQVENEAGPSLSSDDSWSASSPQEVVSIEPWELMIHDIGRKIGVVDFFQKTGLRSVLSTNYFVALGGVLVCLLILILILLIVILVNVSR